MDQFKSDRCGIETYKTLLMYQYHEWFKSDRCGIETSIYSWLGGVNSCSNQTVAGLKHLCQDHATHDWEAFKSDRCGIETMIINFNIPFTLKFKSDRCGIETDKYHIPGQVSHTVQIRPLRDWNETIIPKKMDSETRSNQTVAGLKH